MKLRKTITVILAIILTAFVHQYSLAQSLLRNFGSNLSITAGAAHRTTDFRWSIAGNEQGKDPNILSELIYNPINSAGIQLAANYRFFKKFTLRSGFSYLGTYKGSATDIDYDGDNRTAYLPPSRGDTLFDSHRGNIKQYDISLSYDLFKNSIFDVRAGAGFNSSRELFYLRDDAMPDLNTTYLARWVAASIFLNGKVWLTRQLYLNPEVSFLPGRYTASANWNEQADFKHPVSFIHDAASSGWNYSAAIGYHFNRHIGISSSWQYSNWKTQPGVDRLFLKNGNKPETQMNGAFKRSSSLQLNATYTF